MGKEEEGWGEKGRGSEIRIEDGSEKLGASG
jgi:hypothetical protein